MSMFRKNGAEQTAETAGPEKTGIGMLLKSMGFDVQDFMKQAADAKVAIGEVIAHFQKRLDKIDADNLILLKAMEENHRNQKQILVQQALILAKLEQLLYGKKSVISCEACGAEFASPVDLQDHSETCVG